MGRVSVFKSRHSPSQKLNIGRKWVQNGCMSELHKRTNPSGSVVYRVRWRQDGAYQSETFKRRAEAVEFRGQVDAAGQRWPEGWIPHHGYAAVAASECPTLGEWAERAILSRPKANDRTRGAYLRQITTHLPAELRAAPLDTITREQLGAWVIDLAERRKPKTVRNVHGLVSSVLNDAVDAGLIGRNVSKGLIASLPSAQHEEPVFLTPDEFAALLAAVPPHYRTFVLFFARTGTRFGEATALGVESVDLGRGTVRIDRAIKRTAEGKFYVGSTKSRRSRRSLTIDPTLVEALRPLVEDRHEGFVFRTERGDRISHSNFTNRVWYRAVDAAEPVIHKRPRVHDLRHTHASWLIEAGVSLPAIQARLGHESITTTIGVYGHLMPDADREAAEAMSRLLGD